MRAYARRFAYSPRAPRIVAEKITELLFLAGAAVTVWLCFGGPLFMLWCDVMVVVGRAAGTVPA
jgi:hypothetical protein